MAADGEFAFDAAWYLDAYPDVAAAVRDGTVSSALHHYLCYGRGEGRQPGPGFDHAWYLAAYPLVLEEIGSADPQAAARHYLTIGRHRGYLPHRAAQRPPNAAAIASRFGGLWIDQPNARDLISGKCELGLIDRDEARLLEHFVEHGYVVLEAALPPAVVQRAAQALDDVYGGEYLGVMFECFAVAAGLIEWQPQLREHAAKALDIHWFSEAIRAAGLHPRLVRFLHLLFERPVLAEQSLGFYRGSAQGMHQDSTILPYTLPLQFAAAWIALEDVTAGAGELMYFDESHRKLPELLYAGAYKSVFEARRSGADPDAIAREVQQRTGQIEAEAERLGLGRRTFIAKRGDVLFWHANLAHGGCPISAAASRKSVVFHYCPKEVMPISTEIRPLLIKKYSEGAYYTSSTY